MGDLRDKVDVKSAVGDAKRLAKAGGPKRYARSWGRARGSDRFPSRPRGKSSRKR